ncbi:MULTISPECIES: hypothetical protein, partial [unclassified Limnospira]
THAGGSVAGLNPKTPSLTFCWVKPKRQKLLLGETQATKLVGAGARSATGKTRQLPEPAPRRSLFKAQPNRVAPALHRNLLITSCRGNLRRIFLRRGNHLPEFR